MCITGAQVFFYLLQDHLQLPMETSGIHQVTNYKDNKVSIQQEQYSAKEIKFFFMYDKINEMEIIILYEMSQQQRGRYQWWNPQNLIHRS